MPETIQRVLVTGANKGIGLATVNAILEHHPQTSVILGSRDPARGEAARQQLVAKHPDRASRLELLTLDVVDDESVQQARATLTGRYGASPPLLYGLVNNAGIGMGEALMTPVLAVNLWGLCRVSDALRDLLPGARG